MRFSLTPQRLDELENERAELAAWVRELEQLELDAYDLILDPSPRHDDDTG